MAKDRKHHFVPVCYLNHFKQGRHIHSFSKKRVNMYVVSMLFANCHISTKLHKIAGGKHLSLKKIFSQRMLNLIWVQ